MKINANTMALDVYDNGVQKSAEEHLVTAARDIEEFLKTGDKVHLKWARNQIVRAHMALEKR